LRKEITLPKYLDDDDTTAKIVYLRDVEGWRWEKIGREFNITAEQARGRYRSIKRNSPQEVKEPGKIVEERIDDNHETVEASFQRIVTLDDLLEIAKVDLQEWKVDHYIVNKWEVGRKATVKRLVYDNGIVNGFTEDTGTVNVEPLFQIKAWLVRIKPVAIKPVIHPIEITVCPERREVKRVDSAVKKALILPDPQFGFSRDLRTNKLSPFHSREALSIAMELADYLQPDVSVWLGDVNDFTMWTDKFVRNPEYYFTVQPALIEAAWVINQIHALSSESVVIEGNHDQRPQIAMTTHLLDAYNLRPADNIDAEAVLSVDNLLGLNRMGVKYIGDWQNANYHLNKNLQCTHGNIARGGTLATARAMLDNQAISTIFGHIHRTEMASKTLVNGGTKTVTAFCPGCLCKTDGSVPGSNREVQWQQGLAVVYYTDEAYSIVPLQIENDTVLFDGIFFKAHDYMPELKKSTTWENW
jgi:hypothetical protein